MSSPQTTEKRIPPFSLQLPSRYYGKLYELATQNQSTPTIEAETAIAAFAESYQGDPLPRIPLADDGWVRRILVQPSTAHAGLLEYVADADDPEQSLPLGAVFRVAIHQYVKLGEE